MPARVEDTVALLAQVPAFASSAPRSSAPWPRWPCPARFAAGEVVFREGDASDTCYIVRSGHARAIREHPDGRQLTLATFGPGDIFGELAMFDDELRSATVEALDELEALAILGDDMRRLMREHAEIAVKLAVSLVRRLRDANERLARQSFQTVQSRVAAVLAQLVEQAQRRGRPAGATSRSPRRRPTSRSSPAPRASRRAASSPCSSGPGVISQGRGRLTVHDPAALQRLCLLSARCPTAGSSSAATR